jgi:hypothetical protein
MTDPTMFKYTIPHPSANRRFSNFLVDKMIGQLVTLDHGEGNEEHIIVSAETVDGKKTVIEVVVVPVRCIRVSEVGLSTTKGDEDA